MLLRDIRIEKRRKDLDAALAIAKKRELEKGTEISRRTRHVEKHTQLDWRFYSKLSCRVGSGLGRKLFGRTCADDSEIVFLNRVRRKYVEGLDLSELSFVAALRTFLTRGGFTSPKEAEN